MSHLSRLSIITIPLFIWFGLAYAEQVSLEPFSVWESHYHGLDVSVLVFEFEGSAGFEFHNDRIFLATYC